MASMTTATATAPAQGAEDYPPMKRQRGHEIDWSMFHKNGIPKEVIVIEDDAEEDLARDLLVASVLCRQSAAGRFTEAQAKNQEARNTPLNSVPPPNSQYESLASSLKRKRISPPPVANEAKRRDAGGLTGPCPPYRPLTQPIKKIASSNIRIEKDHQTHKNLKSDDDDGHYVVVHNEYITDRYQITRLLGQGTFGKVVQARDQTRNKDVAVKVIRSIGKYRSAAKIEARVLDTLRANDEENRNRCIHMRDCFDYRGHICIVTDLLGKSVFDFLKWNGYIPFPNSHIQNFARQLLTSVAYLHDLGLIHTDLKPENILLVDDSYQTFTYNKRIPSCSTNVKRAATRRRVLLDSEIRLIDFGSATFQDEHHSTVVSTRHYRAPEVILGLGWSFPCDIWSVGCLLIEFFTGDALFQTHDDLEHLAMMEAVVGIRVSPHLVQTVNKMSRRVAGNPASKFFKRLKLDYPTMETNRESRNFVKAMKHLEDIVPPTTPFLENFLDLLRKIFVYDPVQRITAKQALNHPWFKEIPQLDDGSVAAKIRLEKEQRKS